MGTEARAIASVIERGLSRLRTLARLLLVGRGLALVLAAVTVAMVSVGMLDFVLRFPSAFRIVLLAGLGAALGWGFVRFVMPGVRFRPPLHEVALRVERSKAGREAGLEGMLASGLQLAHAEPRTPFERALAAQVAERTSRLWSPKLVGAMLAPRSMATAAGLFAVAVVVAVGPAFIWPGLVTTAARRVLTPWSDARWPTRTEVVDGTNVKVHPADQALALRGVLTRTNRREGQTRVTAQYRVIDDGRAGPTQTVVLTAQNRVVDVARGSETAEEGSIASGELFERLIEPGALVLAGSGGARNETEVEYWLQTEDSRTEATRVLVVRPPSVKGATARLEAPAYARESLAALEPNRADGAQMLAIGAEAGATVPSALAGSRVTLTIEHSKPIPSVKPGEAGHSGFVRQALGLETLPDDLEASLNPESWTFAWTLREPTTLRVTLTDQHGLRSADEVVLSFDAVEDAPPTAAVTEPAQDEAVLATAVVPAIGEARDDIAVASVAMDLQVATPPAASAGVGAELTGSPTLVAGPLMPGAPSRVHTASATIELATLNLKEGDEVWLHAIATDGYAFDGVTHEPVRSTPRRLRIISEPQLIEQVRAELQSVRQAAMRLDAEQAEIASAGERVPPPRDLAERQAALGERVATQRETIERLARRAERNNLEDDALDGILGDARSFIGEAATASQRATERIQRAAESQPENPEQSAIDPSEQQEIAEAQDQVRDELDQLVRLLDNGQDAWVARRSVERLLAEQKRLLQQTMDVAGRTTGRDLASLTPDERTELERIAERQQEAADDAADALDELSERSRDLKDADAAQAQAMAIATQRGRSSNIAPKLEEAAQQLAQNQANAAAQRQQEAIDTLEEMLDDLDSAEQRRDQALRRQLASIIDSLDSLIAQQDGQIALLSRARAGATDGAGLDQGMLRVNQNTLGVIDQITAAGREMEVVGNLTLAAATAQGNAIGALRAPADLESADAAERLSATRLRDAKAEAERIDKEAAERDAGRKRKELRAAYREALEQQMDLLKRSEPLVGRELDRRERAGVRQAGEQQDGLRVAMEDLRAKTEELADAQVFTFAHDRMNQDMLSAATALREAKVDRGVLRRQETAARLLQSLLNALADPKDERDFRDQAGGEEGGGGGGGQGQGNDKLIPDLAKLRLLREMQQYVLESTRAAGDDAQSVTTDDLESMGRLQREIAEQARKLLESMAQPEQALPMEEGSPTMEPIEPGGPDGAGGSAGEDRR